MAEPLPRYKNVIQVRQQALKLVIVFWWDEGQAECRPYDLRDAFLKSFDQEMAADKLEKRNNIAFKSLIDS